jgi:hypothetical protein
MTPHLFPFPSCWLSDQALDPMGADRPSAVELLQHPFIVKNARNVDPLKDLLAASSKGVWVSFPLSRPRTRAQVVEGWHACW